MREPFKAPIFYFNPGSAKFLVFRDVKYEHEIVNNFIHSYSDRA